MVLEHLAEMSPDIHVLDTPLDLAKRAADIIARANDTCRDQGRPFVLGLAAGTSPEGVYHVLAERCERGELRFDNCHTFCLDEYYPMPPLSPPSFYQELSAVQNRLGIPEEHRHFLKGNTPRGRVADHCSSYEARILDMGGIDIQIVGMGRNGHVAFNEPGAAPSSRTRRVRLDGRTRKDIGASFEDEEEVPSEALTMGIATILEARTLLLVVHGRHKQPILKRFIEEVPNTKTPVTFLKRHEHLLVLVDRAAMPNPPSLSTRHRGAHS